MSAGACSDEPSVEAFCDAVEQVVAAGPLFPDRTDGEPVADLDALAALRDMTDAAPGEIETHTSVLLAEAEGLAAEAAQRVDATQGSASSVTPTTEPPTTPRPQRAQVESAQAEVTAFVADECDIDLSA